MCFQMFRLVSLWFTLSQRQDIVNSMLTTSNEVMTNDRIFWRLYLWYLNSSVQIYSECLDVHLFIIAFEISHIGVLNCFSKFLQVQSYKFIPLVYQIASRMGSSKDSPGPQSFQVMSGLSYSSSSFLFFLKLNNNKENRSQCWVLS